MSVQPTDDLVAARIGEWDTIAGINPGPVELQTAAQEILDGRVNSTARRLDRTMQYIWRRQKLPHDNRWKRAEDLCQRARQEVQPLVGQSLASSTDDDTRK